MEQPTDTIADNLRNIRENRNFSLDQLSDLTGVSKSMLRQIETGRSNPTIATIWKIANGLRISFTTLLRKPETDAAVKDFKIEKPLTAESEHYRVFPMVPFDPGRSFEIYHIEMDPGTTFTGEPHEGDVEEYLFITEGSINIFINDKTFYVNKNQFIKFQADAEHIYKCISKNMAKGIMLICYHN